MTCLKIDEDSLSPAEENAVRCEYASKLREIADMDYISARVLFKDRCFDQFLYYSHQCLEKYAKSIFLFNDSKQGKKGHNLSKLFYGLKKLNHFEIPSHVEKFVSDLDSTYFARYLSAPFFARKCYLNLLDQTVWYLRIYSQSDLDKITRIKKAIDSGNKKHIKSNAIFLGKLENILLNKNKKYEILKSNLIWKNPYYGLRSLSTNEMNGIWAKTPLFFQGSETEQLKYFNFLSSYIHFESNIKEHFEKIRNKTKRLNRFLRHHS